MPSKNHQSSKHYEVLIENVIAQNLSGLHGLENLQICRDAKVVGQSKYQHQIDVLYKFRIWNTDFLVLVECKQYHNKVGIDDLLEFSARINDIKANKGVFVTSVGYQSGAIEFAAANRIALLVIHGTRCSVVLNDQSSRSVQNLLIRFRTALNNDGSSCVQGLSPSTDCVGLDVACDGVKVAIGLEDLQFDPPAAPICRFEQNEAACYFEDSVFRTVKCGHLLRLLLLQELLDRQRYRSVKIP